MTSLRSWVDIDVDSIIGYEGNPHMQFMMRICGRVYNKVMRINISLSIPIAARKKENA